MRAAAPALLAVVVLAGCGSGVHERTAAPPRASAACAAGEDACLPDVIATMSRRLDALAADCDHRAPFLSMYRQVTREVLESVVARRFDDPAYVARLDALFAALYIRAADAWASGRRDDVPRAWRTAFAAAERREVRGLGDMLLGMNAHISRDLPYALVAAGLRRPDGGDVTADVTAVNADIKRATEPMLRDVVARFDPTVAAVGDLDRWVDPRRIDELIAEWRAEALANGRDLVAAEDAVQRRRVEHRIENNAALRGLLIWRATRYAEPAREAAARRRFCEGAR